MDALLDLLVFAQQTLDKHGEFFPFGATISPAGDLQSAAVGSPDERTKSADVGTVVRCSPGFAPV
jgi:hypothetical protein